MPNNLNLPEFKPDFSEMLRVLRKEKPTRPVLFELFMNGKLYERVSGRKFTNTEKFEWEKMVVDTFAGLGYDYAMINTSDFHFPIKERHSGDTLSLNEGYVITDWKTFEEYNWLNPEDFDPSRLDVVGRYMPEGMKFMVMGPCGVLENVVALMGYDNLCYAIYEEPELVQAVFDAVGSRLLKYYEIALDFDSVGMIMSNDDWGFNTQTFLSAEHMRKYVFTWHKKIAQAAHKAGRPVLLHSCGYMGEIFEDIIEDMGFDGKHSYEDNIIPVEESYRRWGGRVAVMGGIDMDYLCRAEIPDIQKRCRAMLDAAEQKGGYALGSGNSIPEYVPYDKYIAMLSCAWERR